MMDTRTKLMRDLNSRVLDLQVAAEALACYMPSGPCSNLFSSNWQVIEGLLGSIKHLAEEAHTDYLAVLGLDKEGGV